MFIKDIIKEYSVRNKDQNDYPVYSVTNSQGFCRDYFGKEVASKDKSSYKIVPYGCFAYNPSRINVGSIDWQHCEQYVIVSPIYNVFEVNTTIARQDYLSYYFKSRIVHDYINTFAKGTVRLNVPLSTLGSFPIPVPPIAEQERIVAELDLLQGIIEKKKEQLKAYDQLAQSIFYTMFGDPIDNPKGWEVKKMEDCFIIGSGGTPSKAVPDYWEGGDIPWIGSNMCQNCIIEKTDGKFITEDGLNHSSAKMVESGTVLVALVGATIGKVALLKTNTAINQNIAFIKLKKPKSFIPEFVYYHLMGQYDEFMNIGDGKFKMANQAFIKALSICLPPLSLQQEFAEKVEAIERQKALVQQSIVETQTMFDYAMDKYFG